MSPLRFFLDHNSPVEPAELVEIDEVFIEDTDVSEFDQVIGAIEDIAISKDFQTLQNSLLEMYCHHFEASEENKLIYTSIFRAYTTEIENYIESQLSQRFSHFSMETFLTQLTERPEVLEGDIFELLYSLSDFLSFKEMFVDYKTMKDRRGQGEDLSDLLAVSSITKLTDAEPLQNQ